MLKQTLPSIEELTRLIEAAASGRSHPSVVQRLTVLRYFVQHRPTVVELCRHFGISRSTFHRWVERFDAADPLSLKDRLQEGRGDRSASLPEGTVELIRCYRHDDPLCGKERIASLLRQRNGITVSASTVGRVIERECLYFGDTLLHWTKRARHGDGTGECLAGSSMQSSPQPYERQPVPVTGTVTSPPRQDASSPVVHVHVPAVPEPRTSFSGFMRFFVMTSLLINIVFVSMLIGMALFERSTRSVDPRMEAADVPADTQRSDVLHGAASTLVFP